MKSRFDIFEFEFNKRFYLSMDVDLSSLTYNDGAQGPKLTEFNNVKKNYHLFYLKMIAHIN